MRVLVAMSGGVDSSVAAALLAEQGHEVVGATMKLWGGESDSGCCSVADVDDARRVAQQLGIPHHVFNFGDEFDTKIVAPFIRSHQSGETPNPCIECNRHIKFDRFLERAAHLDFDMIATGHHAQIIKRDGVLRMARGADQFKDQSYVLYMLNQAQLAKTMLPIGHMTKPQVREHAERLGLRTAKKPDSLDVCFIRSDEGRDKFLSERVDLHPANIFDLETEAEVGAVSAVELMTVGQRRGVSPGIDGRARFVVDVDVASQRISIGTLDRIQAARVELRDVVWSHEPIAVGTAVSVQGSAHGAPLSATFVGDAVEFDAPQRRIAPGQSVVIYEDDVVLGGGICVK
jgi:tRNA-specific 2-thiouridylase